MNLTNRTQSPQTLPRESTRVVTPPPHRFRFAVFAALFAIVVAAAFYIHRVAGRRAAAEAGPAIRTVQVTKGTLERTLRLTGATAAQGSVFLRTPRMRGQRSRGGGSGDFRLQLAELAPNGAMVKPGDLVASFDNVYMQNRLDDIDAERSNLVSSLQVVRSAAELARAVHQQSIKVARANMDKAALDLKTAEVRSAIQVERFRIAFEESKAVYESLLKEVPYYDASLGANIRESELRVQESAVEARRARMNLERLSITAPIGGMVVASTIRRGSEIVEIKSGDELGAGQHFVQIVDPGSILVEAKANQVDVERIRIGSPVRVRIDAFPGLTLEGKLQAIGALAVSPGRQSDHLREVNVTVSLNESDPRLIPNLSASADVIIDREEDAHIVPLDGIFEDPALGQTVAFVRTNGGWEKRPVEIGLANNLAAVVVSGLDPGDQIATEIPSGENQAQRLY